MRYRRTLLACICVMACGYAQECPYTWRDPETGCEFPLGEPSCKHYAMWVDVHSAAKSIWPHMPCALRVTIIEEPTDLIYRNGEWEAWQVGRAGFASFGKGTPEVFIAGFYPDEFVPLIMAHELVHIVWRLDEHSDTFWQHNEELLAAMGIL